MRCTFRSPVAAVLAAAMTLSTLTLTLAQATASKPQIKAPATLDLSARSRHRHHRYHDNSAAAFRMFGLMMGTIATIAAADRARSDCRRYGYCYYGYGPPPPYYYGYRRYYYPY